MYMYYCIIFQCESIMIPILCWSDLLWLLLELGHIYMHIASNFSVHSIVVPVL